MFTYHAALAQSVERRSRKAKVVGPIPAGGSLTLCEKYSSFGRTQ